MISVPAIFLSAYQIYEIQLLIGSYHGLGAFVLLFGLRK